MKLINKILTIDNEHISCEYLIKETTVIILHGAGQADRKRYYPFVRALLNQGFGVVLFDFSGHGESSGDLKELSLRRRQHQAEAVIKRLVPATCKLILVGFSMSGQTVCDLIPVFSDRIKSILLGCPAIYTAAASAIPFGNPDFTYAIRQPNSWKDSSALEVLRHFKGRVVIAMGTLDTVIPIEVIKAIHAAAPNSTLHSYNGVGHQLAMWLGTHPSLLEKLLQEL